MILKNGDKDPLQFEWLEPQGGRIASMNEKSSRFLPIDVMGVEEE